LQSLSSPLSVPFVRPPLQSCITPQLTNVHDVTDAQTCSTTTSYGFTELWPTDITTTVTKTATAVQTLASTVIVTTTQTGMSTSFVAFYAVFAKRV
jgi:hypothetical protein